MTPKLPRGLLALALLLLSICAAAQKKPGDYTVEDFFRHAQFTNMQLSPNGELLAAGVPFKGRVNLVVIDVAKRERNVITAFEKVDVANFFWVNNERLCVRAADGQSVTGEITYRGTYCVDRDGKNFRDFTTIGIRNPAIGRTRTITLLGTLSDGSPDIIAALAERSEDSVDAYRFNTRTGRMELLTTDSPGDVQRFVLDRNQVPRIAVSQPERKGKGPQMRYIYHRADASSKWEKIAEVEMIGSSWTAKDDFSPIAFDFDNRTLYVASNAGRDKMAIYKYDTTTKKMGDLMFEHPLVDVQGGLIFSRAQKALLGISFEADKPVTRWVDEDMDKLQRSVDARFPKTTNRITVPADAMHRALVFSGSDVDPGMYRLYHRDRNGVEELAKTREWLDPAAMSERRFFTYKARDGRVIPAYVTIPRGSSGKNLPLIVNIHGGPWARSYSWAQWGRWPEAQFFASRGYAVLEPEPRGSTGFGRDHFVSSFRQWGQAMQDDITDGALHLVNEGIVDKSRMCLHGGSYGGYATAMGLAKDPDLWRCGSPLVAVTSLFLFQEVVYSDIAQGTDFFETDFKKMVGDKRDDREMFTKYSPVLQADKVKAAVFLTMGGNDVRVPQVHGDEFYNALTKAGVKVEYKVYPGEGHGYNKDEHVFDYYRRLEKFYADNLK